MVLNMANKKMTKKENFMALADLIQGIEVTNKEELQAFINNELELLNKKRSRKGGVTKTQKENMALKKRILATITELNEPMSPTDILTVSEFEEYSNQKISALLNQLVKEGTLTKAKDGSRTVFSIEEEPTEEIEEETNRMLVVDEE